MKLVIIESPYAGDVERNVDYARLCVRDSLETGEAPIASHLLYTQPTILDDNDEKERQWGIDAGLAWRTVAEATVVYTDFGVTDGMQYGIDKAKKDGKLCSYRSLNGSAEFTELLKKYENRDKIREVVKFVKNDAIKKFNALQPDDPVA